MSSKLVDIINLNGEASCLSSERWLDLLKGGHNSYLYQYFNLYVKHQKKAVLGIPGVTIIDIVQFNPEVIELINQHPTVFEIIVRPFVHDIALLRTEEAFELNLRLGIAILEAHFTALTPVFLPPEFMLKSEQVNILLDNGIATTFINPSRFSEESQKRIPKKSYNIRGSLGKEMQVIPFAKDLTKSYLNSLHYYKSASWNSFIHTQPTEIVYSWRDGESPFFIDDGIRREDTWLAQEDPKIKRLFLRDALKNLDVEQEMKPTHYKYYPPHTFNPWMKELRMMGFLQRVYDLEKGISSMSNDELVIFFQTLNSDILSAVEKKSPVIKLQISPEDNREQVFTIWRTDRNFEGEDFLAIYTHFKQPNTKQYLENSALPHIQKLRKRISYFNEKNILQPLIHHQSKYALNDY